jgi:osmotically-inducible protein OsmY
MAKEENISLGNTDEEYLKRWRENYNTPEHYRVKRTEFEHGQHRTMVPPNDEEFPAVGYRGRDIEANAGYRDSYQTLDEHEKTGYEKTRWRNQHSAKGSIGYGPHRGKGPKSYQRPDERIREDIHDRLRDDAYIDATHVEVTVDQGEVILSGTVDDRHAKRRAAYICEDVLGVKNVENRLRVNERAGQEIQGRSERRRE